LPMQRLRELITVIEDIAPPELAADWDNTGLQVGDPDMKVGRVMVALDPLPGTVSEAAGSGCGLLVTHHPLFFRPIKSIDLSHGAGEAVKLAVERGVAIYSAHTSLDRIPNGVSDVLAGMLGIRRARPMERAEGFPAGYGFGRVGVLQAKTTVRRTAQKLKKALDVDAVRVTGDMDKGIRRVAVCGGSGAELIEAAVRAGADVYVTGDVKYHDALKAAELGLAVIDVGHLGSELPVVYEFAILLRKAFMKKGFKVAVEVSAARKEPWTYL
jgi:dinuclear metal center YbgI/SA1388 family protein